MFTIENLHVRHSGKDNETLKGINLSLESGKIHGLVGLNGAGKTTLLNTLYRFTEPVNGKLTYNGKPLQRQHIAYLETENYFYPDMTGREYLLLFPTGATGFDIEKWQKLFNIPLDDTTESYSAGMCRKLALMAAFKPDKPILMLDEPFNGLDLESVHLLTMILNQMRGMEKTVIVTSHIYESLTGCCDFIHHLSDGIIANTYAQKDFGVLKEELQATIEQRSQHLVSELIAGKDL